MDLEIVTRYSLDLPDFKGRVYVFLDNFSNTWGTLGVATDHIYRVLESPELQEARDKKFSLTHAIMWGKNEGKKVGDKMIDFFGIGPDNYLDKALGNFWHGNPEVLSWVTQNGVVVPKNGISEVTCKNGFTIISKELEHIDETPDIDAYLNIPPTIPGLIFYDKDHSYSTIRKKN